MIRRRAVRLLFAFALGASLLGPAAAQTPLPAPTPIVVPTLPPTDATTQAIIHAAVGVLNDIIARNRSTAANSTQGRVVYFRRYDLQVQTGSNNYRDVHLHAGTVIDPRGATPNVGASVAIVGSGRPDGSLDADAITVLH